jgi:streptogramin lyase
MIRSQFISLWRRKSFVAFVVVFVLALVLTRGLATPQQRAQAGSLEFVGEWGMRGENPGELAQPAGLAVDGANRVYIADRRTGLLQKFEENGVPSLASEDISVRTAAALAVDSGGAIYVADVRGGRVWIHYPEGDVLRNFRVASQRSADPAFTFCITSTGLIIVPDPDGGRLQAFNATGRLENIWRLPPISASKPARPIAVALGFDDFVYAGDAATGRIVKFNGQGEQIAVWEPPADVAGVLRGIAVSRNYVLVLRGAQPQLEVWNPLGERLLTQSFGSHLDSAAEASLYFAASLDDQIFLLDPTRQRVLRFKLRMPAR